MEAGQKPRQITNLQSLYCYTFPQYFVLESSKKKDPWDASTKVLRIDRKTFEVKQLTKAEVDFTQKNYVIRSFSSFLGLVSFHGINFLLFCEQCHQVFSHDDGFQVYEIGSIFMVCALNDQQLIMTGKKRSVLTKITMLNELLSKGFYYSHGYNLTQSREFQQQGLRDQFTWNREYLADLRKITPALSSLWITPVVQGYAASFECFLQGTLIKYSLLSRRSCEKGGTRYFDRGVNQHGFVANFVQTQQIVYVGPRFVASDVQVRGSVPIYFEQKGLTTKVQISRSFQLTRASFLEHFEYLTKRFERTFCINLLAQHKKGENRITQQFERHVKETQGDPPFKYAYFDFHKECSGMNFAAVNPFITKIASVKGNLQYYIFDRKSGVVLERQRGVFRTNCLDCLDRTNFVQAKLALLTLENILTHFGFPLAQQFGCSAIEQMDKKDSNSSLLKEFKSLWADNGDMISFHYTGTGSTHTDVTRQGARSFKGIFTHKIKTITRFYNQNFSDFHKMKMVDLILKSNVSSLETEQVPTLMRERQNKYCQFSTLTLTMLTWKLSNCSTPKEPLDLVKSDVVVVGFQQVESGSSVFNYSHSTGSRVSLWKDFLLNTCLGQEYIQVSQAYHSNNLCLVLAKRQLKDRISCIQSSYVKFSSYFNTYLSNKCAVIVRFKIDDTSMAFASCQLEYGKDCAKNRVYNIREIFKCAFQEEEVGKKKGDLFDNSTYRFIFGNLNMNLKMQEELVKARLRAVVTAYYELKGMQESAQKAERTGRVKQIITDLIKFDDSVDLKENCEHFRQYEEGTIDFIPPYKYVKGKVRLDQSKIPGWVDRIFYDSDEPIICKHYSVSEVSRPYLLSITTLQIFMSDHLPVVSQFELRAIKEDEDKKQQVYKEILEQLKIAKQQEVDESDSDQDHPAVNI